MVAIGSSFFTAPDRHPVLAGSGPEVVVWLRGQHDASTETALCMTLARAIAFGGPGLVLDLADVRVMSTSTLAVIARAREYLRQRSASLTVRSPSTPVRLLMDACALNDLLGPEPKGRDGEGGERPVLRLSQPVPVPKRARRTSARAPV
jgi:anti-anti-sigma factor